jgi:hypothetical protein
MMGKRMRAERDGISIERRREGIRGKPLEYKKEKV